MDCGLVTVSSSLHVLYHHKGLIITTHHPPGVSPPRVEW